MRGAWSSVSRDQQTTLLSAITGPAVIAAKTSRYWSKIAIFVLVMEGSFLEYCRNVRYRKTRMVWLPDGEKTI